jgi:hypothetical protein
MIFKVDKNFKTILNPEAVKLVPELAALSQEELIFVILVEDYCDSPFRKKPYDERRSLAIKRVFGDNPINLETNKIKVARDLYRSLVFDIRRETLDVFKKKVDLYHKETLAMGIEFKRLKELDQAIQYLEERILSIETNLAADDITNVKLKGDRQLSYIEIWQKRQQEYRKFKQTT